MKKNILSVATLLLFVLTQATFAQNIKPAAEPTVFMPGLFSTGDYEAVPEFSPDGKTFYYAKGTPDFNFWTICFSDYENSRWSEPQVAPFSGKYSDADEFITYDNQKMFFISKRPVSAEISPNATNKFDIWMMNKTANGWGEPQNLGKNINSEKNEYFPTLTRDGKTLYFGSQWAGGKGGVDLYYSKLINEKWSAAENLGDVINTNADEFEPFIAPDESYLIFMASGRPDSLGGFDLYISYNENGKWTKPQNLGAPVNSAADELSPKITPDGKYFFWSSSRSRIDQPRMKNWNFAELSNNLHSPQNGLGDIYYIDVQALKLSDKK